MSHTRAATDNPNALRTQIIIKLAEVMSTSLRPSRGQTHEQYQKAIEIILKVLFATIHNINENDCGNKPQMQILLRVCIAQLNPSPLEQALTLIKQRITVRMHDTSQYNEDFKQAPAVVAVKFSEASFVEHLFVLCNFLSRRSDSALLINNHTNAIIIFAITTLFADVHNSIKSLVLRELAHKEHDFKHLTIHAALDYSPLTNILLELEQILINDIDVSIANFSTLHKSEAYYQRAMIYYAQARWGKALKEFDRAGRIAPNDTKLAMQHYTDWAVAKAWESFGNCSEFINLVLAPVNNTVVPFPRNLNCENQIINGLFKIADLRLRHQVILHILLPDTFLGGILQAVALQQNNIHTQPKLMALADSLTFELKRTGNEIIIDDGLKMLWHQSRSLRHYVSQNYPTIYLWCEANIPPLAAMLTPLPPVAWDYEGIDETTFSTFLAKEIEKDTFNTINDLLILLKIRKEQAELEIDFSDFPSNFICADTGLISKSPILLYERPVTSNPFTQRNLPSFSLLADRRQQISTDQECLTAYQLKSDKQLCYLANVNLRWEMSHYFFKKLKHLQYQAKIAPATTSILLKKYGALFKTPALKPEPIANPAPVVARM
jgi:tetratricopeptide (TPR) repeat protein